MTMKAALFIVLLSVGLAGANAQEVDSIRRQPADTTAGALDSLSQTRGAADTTETRRERRQREKRERETKEQEKVVFKDSARLALEALNRRTWRRSLFVPGWGQYTNGGWWWLKVPVIYGGFVSAALIFEFNNRYYHDILSDIQYRLANNHAVPLDPNFPAQQRGQQYTEHMITAKDYYRRNRDLTVLITIGWWGLQTVEAYVNSMLKYRWNIGDDLAIKMSPTLLAQPTGSLAFHQPYAVGFKVNMKF